MELGKSKYLFCGTLENVERHNLESISITRSTIPKLIEFMVNNGTKLFIYERIGKSEYILIYKDIIYMDKTPKEILEILFNEFYEIREKQKRDYYTKER